MQEQQVTTKRYPTQLIPATRKLSQLSQGERAAILARQSKPYWKVSRTMQALRRHKTGLSSADLTTLDETKWAKNGKLVAVAPQPPKTANVRSVATPAFLPLNLDVNGVTALLSACKAELGNVAADISHSIVLATAGGNVGETISQALASHPKFAQLTKIRATLESLAAQVAEYTQPAPAVVNA